MIDSVRLENTLLGNRRKPAAALRALLQEQMLSVSALDFREDWRFHIEIVFHLIDRSQMSDSQIDVCGKCGAEIDPTRRVDFTLKDGTRVCDACFVKETPRASRPKNDWAN